MGLHGSSFFSLSSRCLIVICTSFCIYSPDVPKSFLVQMIFLVMSVNPASFSVGQLEKYKTTPALPLPPGIVSNFAARNQRANIYKIPCATLLGIVYIFVCIRMYVKVWIKRRPGFDDRKLPNVFSLIVHCCDGRFAQPNTATLLTHMVL